MKASEGTFASQRTECRFGFLAAVIATIVGCTNDSLPKERLRSRMGVKPVKFTATTDSSGIGMPISSPPELLGFPPGFYDVEVEHGGKTWNFGVEMADDNPRVTARNSISKKSSEELA